MREQLSVPFVQEKTIRTPDPEVVEVEINGYHNGCIVVRDSPTISSLMTAVYQSMRSGELYEPVVECLKETNKETTKSVVSQQSQ